MTNPTETTPSPMSGGKTSGGPRKLEPRRLTDAELDFMLRSLLSPKVMGKTWKRDDLRLIVADLAESMPLRLLDAGDLFNPAELQMRWQEYPEPWERVSCTWARSPRQMLTILEETLSFGPALVVLDLLRPFRDARLPFEERRRLLQACLPHLLRLHRFSHVTVCICLPETLDAEMKEFFRLLATMALKTHNLVVVSSSRK